MATNTTSIPNTWTLISSGPQTSISIQPLSGTLIYRIAATIPANTVNDGHSVASGNLGHTVTLESGENLYGRAESASSITLATTV